MDDRYKTEVLLKNALNMANGSKNYLLSTSVKSSHRQERRSKLHTRRKFKIKYSSAAMGKLKITHKQRNKDPLKYYKSIAVSIGKIVKTSTNQDFRKECLTILGISNAAEVEEQLMQLIQKQ